MSEVLEYADKVPYTQNIYVFLNGELGKNIFKFYAKEKKLGLLLNINAKQFFEKLEENHLNKNGNEKIKVEYLKMIQSCQKAVTNSLKFGDLLHYTLYKLEISETVFLENLIEVKPEKKNKFIADLVRSNILSTDTVKSLFKNDDYKDLVLNNITSEKYFDVLRDENISLYHSVSYGEHKVSLMCKVLKLKSDKNEYIQEKEKIKVFQEMTEDKENIVNNTTLMTFIVNGKEKKALSLKNVDYEKKFVNNFLRKEENIIDVMLNSTLYSQTVRWILSKSYYKKTLKKNVEKNPLVLLASMYKKIMGNEDNVNYGNLLKISDTIYDIEFENLKKNNKFSAKDFLVSFIEKNPTLIIPKSNGSELDFYKMFFTLYHKADLTEKISIKGKGGNQTVSIQSYLLGTLILIASKTPIAKEYGEHNEIIQDVFSNLSKDELLNFITKHVKAGKLMIEGKLGDVASDKLINIYKPFMIEAINVLDRKSNGEFLIDDLVSEFIQIEGEIDKSNTEYIQVKLDTLKEMRLLKILEKDNVKPKPTRVLKKI